MRRLNKRTTWKRTWANGWLLGVIFLFIAGCAGTPKGSVWIASNNLTYHQVFAAASRAGTMTGFTIVNADRTSGYISMRKETYAGDRQAERRMTVYLEKMGDEIVVSTKIVGSNFGIIEGAMGGLVHNELTHNFYVYLFRELNITDPSLCHVVIEDAK